MLLRKAANKYCTKPRNVGMIHKDHSSDQQWVTIEEAYTTYCIVKQFLKSDTMVKQEPSYHKQIARQLRTQYVEGICDNPVTLKSRLRVTQSHWKRNHWINHT